MTNNTIAKRRQNDCGTTSSKMVFNFRLGFLTLLLTTLSMTGSYKALAGSTLTAKQIRGEIIGKWLTYKGSKGNMQLRLGTDGKIYGRSTGGYYIQGTYKLKGNRYCSKIKLRNYKEQCGTFTKLGKGRYRYSATGAVLRRK
ncbi:MAG: hypothetical protein ACR2PH_07775 [Desulfobulbia bacterium]